MTTHTETVTGQQAPFPDVATQDDVIREVGEALSWSGGNVLGLSLKSDLLHAIELKGEKEDREKVVQLLNSLGFDDVDFSNIDSYEWYPAGWEPAILLAAAHLFSWSAEDIEGLGVVSTRGSVLLKIIMRFVSMKRVFKEGSTSWKKYYDFGELKPITYSDDENLCVFQIHGYNVHPITEYFQKGYFKGITEMATGSDSVEVRVTRSPYSGAPYSEYRLSW